MSEGKRDVVWEALSDAAATAATWREEPLRIVLECVLNAHDKDRIGQLAKFLELNWCEGMGDHPKVEERMMRQEALASLGVAG